MSVAEPPKDTRFTQIAGVSLLAGDGGPIRQAVETQIAEIAELRGIRIQVHVDQRLVVLAGEVRLYEQKLVSERVAWTTPGVAEVGNEIQVVPTPALTDAAIERAIWTVVKGDAGFVVAGLVVRIHLVKGQAATEIPELIRNEGIDLLVMGTVCRTGVVGFFIGNTAESVLANVDCSVLSVKPEGFVTPVTLPEA